MSGSEPRTITRCAARELLLRYALHELGHALGLKHSQETGGVANVAVPAAHDDSEYTVMSYRSYVGAPLYRIHRRSLRLFADLHGERHSRPADALWRELHDPQRKHRLLLESDHWAEVHQRRCAAAPGDGAGGSANRIFETVWDGNGVDTYDLSNYTTACNGSISIPAHPRSRRPRRSPISATATMRAGKHLQRLFVQRRCAILYRQCHRRFGQRCHHRQCDRQRAEWRMTTVIAMRGRCLDPQALPPGENPKRPTFRGLQAMARA